MSDVSVSALGYADGATGGVAKYVRLDTLTYPNGRVVQYSYNTAGSDDDALSRINLIHDNATNKDLADYDWVGAYDFAGQVLHPNVSGGLTLTFGYGGNQMQGWDRFGRVIRVQWRNIPVGGVTTELDRFDYKYDRTGNRLTADRSVTVTGVNNDDNYSESYEYDGLDRLVDFRRGVQDGTGVVPKLPTSTSLKFRQTWGTLDASGVVTTVGLDALGNWAKFVQDADGGGATAAVTQTRTANAVNEIGSVTGNSPAWATPAYDAGGNMTTVPKGGSESTPVYFVYDGWNRLAGISATAVPDGDFVDATEVQYKYDGLGRRIAKDFAGGTASDEDSYYNEAYQELETRKAGSSSPYQQSVWDLRYVDAPLVRYRNADANTGTGTGGMEETLYETYDANYDVTGLVKEDETFVERYVYTPYGDRTVLTGTFAARGTSSYDFQLGHQGLRLDAESGTYYDRGRQDPYSLGVFGGRDPNGTDYQDGTNLYEEYQGNPTGMVDPAGTEAQGFNGPSAMGGSGFGPGVAGVSGPGFESGGPVWQARQQQALRQQLLAEQMKQAKLDGGEGGWTGVWRGGWMGAQGSGAQKKIGQKAKEGASDGAKAWANGFVPFGDPFGPDSFYDPCDPNLKWSELAGHVSRDAWLGAAFAKINPEWRKNPFLYELGQKTLPNNLFEKLQDLSPVERGSYLWNEYGLASLVPSLTSAWGKTLLGTTPTPGGMIGGLELADYLAHKFGNPLDNQKTPCPCA